MMDGDGSHRRARGRRRTLDLAARLWAPPYRGSERNAANFSFRIRPDRGRFVVSRNRDFSGSAAAAVGMPRAIEPRTGGKAYFNPCARNSISPGRFTRFSTPDMWSEPASAQRFRAFETSDWETEPADFSVLLTHDCRAGTAGSGQATRVRMHSGAVQEIPNAVYHRRNRALARPISP
jgi:hypothetical protein